MLRITRTVEAAERSERSLVYCYERELDHCGHAYGWRSQEWLDCLIRIDRWCSWLRAELPEEVRLIITADHGMVDVPDDRRLVVEAEPDLLAGVRQLAGEARFRQLYLEPGRPRVPSPAGGRIGSVMRPGCVPVTRPWRRAGSGH